MKRNMIKRFISKALIILTLLLFVGQPFKMVRADNVSSNEVVENIKEEKEEDYSVLYTALVISLLSLGLVFLNKNDSKKEVEKESTKSIKNKDKKEAEIKERTQVKKSKKGKRK